ncbi:MAG: deoxyribonuclease IV [Spirochaetales bacterium]|nr:deoxyribonuclease IV [Spirochaetales bacterium]
MLHIGCHESSSKGYVAMWKEALQLDANTFAFFTRNPRGGTAKPIDSDDVTTFCSLAKEHNFAKIVAHAPYTMNPCAAKPELRDFALNTMLDDLSRLEYTPGNYYNFHPGSHVGQGVDIGIDLTAEMLSSVIKRCEKLSTVILIETMAGKGSEIGRTFEEIRMIIDKTEEKCGTSLSDKLGVCLDTCHVWDGGYDIVNDLDGVLTHFDNIIGLERLKAVHLNDSMNLLDSHKDRHAKIGEGQIGLEALVKIINHAKLKNLPFILETPNEHEGYKKEIALLRSKFIDC